MTDYIPGVWYVPSPVYQHGYEVSTYHPCHVFQYSPRRHLDDRAWIDAKGKRYNDVEVTGYVGGKPQHNLVEVFNPHPPTGIEWGFRDDVGTWSIGDNDEHRDEAASESRIREGALLKRPVGKWEVVEDD